MGYRHRAHIDWPPQCHLIEVVNNHDGTLSIFATMVDHGGGRLLTLARELMGNDPQTGFSHGTGEEADRNVELVLAHPFPGESGRRRGGAGVAIPSSGVPTNLTLGGALAMVGRGSWSLSGSAT